MIGAAREVRMIGAHVDQKIRDDCHKPSDGSQSGRGDIRLWET